MISDILVPKNYKKGGKVDLEGTKKTRIVFKSLSLRIHFGFFFHSGFLTSASIIELLRFVRKAQFVFYFVWCEGLSKPQTWQHKLFKQRRKDL